MFGFCLRYLHIIHLHSMQILMRLIRLWYYFCRIWYHCCRCVTFVRFSIRCGSLSNDFFLVFLLWFCWPPHSCTSAEVISHLSTGWPSWKNTWRNKHDSIKFMSLTSVPVLFTPSYLSCSIFQPPRQWPLPLILGRHLVC